MVGHGSLALFLFTAQLLASCSADHMFNWKFGNNFILTDLPECKTFPIIVTSLTDNTSAVGVPPYYMIAFELGGVPTTQNIGNDSANLSWLVDHAAGSTLMLTMVDSNASTGGIPNNFFNVTTGGTNTCHPTPNRATLASITPNVTDHLDTCQPWGLTISGGQKPYTVVISALNSPVITNVTMGPNDDVLTWPDRADPDGEVMASVLDNAGQWGVSTKNVHTQGSKDPACIGWRTTSSTTAQIAADKAAREKAEKEAADRRSRNLIISAVLGTTLPLIFIAIAIGVWRWRRKVLSDRDRGIWDGQDINPRAFDPPTVITAEDQVEEMREVGCLESNSLSDSKLSPYGSSNNHSSLPLLHSHSHSTSEPPLTPTTVSAEAGSTSLTSRPSYTSSGGQSAARNAEQRKALEARLESQRRKPSYQGSNPSLRSQRNYPGLPPGALPPLTPGSSGLPQHPISSTLDPDVQPDIIIQHRDGGSGVVQELPPPYVDRSRISSSQTTSRGPTRP